MIKPGGISEEDQIKLLLLGLRFHPRFEHRDGWFLLRDSPAPLAPHALRWRSKTTDNYSAPRVIKTPANFIDAAIRWAAQDEYWY